MWVRGWIRTLAYSLGSDARPARGRIPVSFVWLHSDELAHQVDAARAPPHGREGGPRHPMYARTVEVGPSWQLHGLLLGRKGLLQRIGFDSLLEQEITQGRSPSNMVLWERVLLFDPGGRLVVREA